MNRIRNFLQGSTRRTQLLILFAACGLALAASAQDAVVTERGPHHRKIQTVTEKLTSYFRPLRITNSFIELATSMHYRDDEGNWRDSKAIIELFPPEAAIARQGPMQVIFPANIRTFGGIDVFVDNKRFRSHLLGIGYAEADTGRAVMIAELRDSIGLLVSDNQLIYPAALIGEIEADVQYIYNIFGLQQNIILRNTIDPAVYGLNPATVRVQVFTEWVEVPEPTKRVTIVKRTLDPALRARMLDPDLIDEELSFGSVFMPQGAAFPLSDEDHAVPAGKTFEVRDGRQLLVEQVDYTDIKPYLDPLPKAAAAAGNNPNALMAKVKPALPVGRGVPAEPLSRPFIPAAPPRQAALKGKIERRQLAALRPAGKGYVLDWTLLNANTNDFTFRGDTTYLITSSVTLTGSNVLEPGCVIKYTNYPASSSAKLLISGPLTCLGTEYRPIFLTSMHDDTVGEVIPNSTGNPTTNYAGRTHLHLAYSTSQFNLHNIHSRYAKEAIAVHSSSSLILRHSIIGDCDRALGNHYTLFLRNVLLHDAITALYSNSGTPTNRAEHVTFHRVSTFSTGPTTNFLTNSLIISATNGVLWSGANVETSSSDSGIFTTAGYGQRYLASGSPYRNIGTANIDSTLAADLKQRTTYPPIALSDNITIDTTLFPQAQRDTDALDLGFHYLPADWLLMGGLTITGATLTVKYGACVGMDAAPTNYAVRLDSGASLISEGAPVFLNRFARTHSFQEVASGKGNLTTPLFADTYPAPASPAAVRLRLTDVPLIQRQFAFSQENNRGTLNTLVVHDSQLRGGTNFLSPSVTNQFMAFTNLLFEDCSFHLYAYAPCTLEIHNSTFKRGALTLEPGGTSSCTIKDNIFDYTTFYQNPSATISNDYNGYLTNSARLTPNGASDLVLATNTVNFQTGVLGSYYLPTNSLFIDAGSVTNAGFVGLWHYTTQTSQTKEAGTRLDLGFHYVALDGANQAIDTDADGIPDYLEDLTGNGSVDSGETDWNSASDLGLAVRITRPANNSTIP